MMMKSTIAVSLASVLALTACESNTTNIQDPNYRAKNGAATGAVIGGLLGASTAHNGRDRLGATLLGAAAGGLLGGAIGNNLDTQAADLRSRLGNPNVSVTNMGTYLLVNLPDDVLFATGSAAVRPDLQGELRSIAANLISYPASTIQVIGHTDNVGAAAYNVDLSIGRATSVRDILVGAGVPAGRVAAFGQGEAQPVASNLTTAGRAQNRRVEIIITPKSR
ncbi:MAG: OmpA family protein [Paracoccaceae bacterium]